MTKILIITNYYPPETGAASNRIHQMAKSLAGQGYELKVLTPLPNYPRGKVYNEYRGKFSQKRIEDGIEVYRLWIFASNSKNIFLRLLAMLSYSFSLMWYLLFNGVPRIVIIQSPPILVAFTALQALRFRGGMRILNVSDIWPLAGLELGALKPGLFYKLLERVERSNYRRSALILGQSKEILSHISKVLPDKQTILYRNYPELDLPPLKAHSAGKPIKLVYAGLLGVAQGVHKLCENLDFSLVELHIYGQGAEKKAIETFSDRHPDKPVHYHGEIERGRLHEELLKYDLAIIPLLNRIYGSVPSKIFEFSMLGIPLLYFGGGEGENIVNENRLGWTAKAGNYDSLNNVLRTITPDLLGLERRKSIRAAALKEFNFQSQLNGLIFKLRELDQ